MDKYLFGKLLGEVYRTQSRLGHAAVSEGVVYGLVNGVEIAIDEEIRRLAKISKEDYQRAADIFNKYYLNEEKLEKVKGYYDLENELINAGLDRGKMITIVTYMKAEGVFIELIEKFDSSNSPSEMRNFDLHEYDQ